MPVGVFFVQDKQVSVQESLRKKVSEKKSQKKRSQNKKSLRTKIVSEGD